MSELRINVVAGQSKKVVGTILPQVGMKTSAGVVVRVTPTTVLFEQDGQQSRRRTFHDVTVRHTTAVKFGYPNAMWCHRKETHYIRRGNKYIAA